MRIKSGRQKLARKLEMKINATLWWNKNIPFLCSTSQFWEMTWTLTLILLQITLLKLNHTSNRWKKLQWLKLTTRNHQANVITLLRLHRLITLWSSWTSSRAASMTCLITMWKAMECLLRHPWMVQSYRRSRTEIHNKFKNGNKALSLTQNSWVQNHTSSSKPFLLVGKTVWITTLMMSRFSMSLTTTLV